MTFGDYQQQIGNLQADMESERNYVFMVLGLAGEVGEIAEAVKKNLRDGSEDMSDEQREDLKLELGYVLTYVSQFAAKLGLDLDDIAQASVAKLTERNKAE